MRSQFASRVRQAVAVLTPLIPVFLLIVVSGKRW
jgi:hypothetical protein